jgi:hypothetical protein
MCVSSKPVTSSAASSQLPQSDDTEDEEWVRSALKLGAEFIAPKDSEEDITSQLPARRSCDDRSVAEEASETVRLRTRRWRSGWTPSEMSSEGEVEKELAWG